MLGFSSLFATVSAFAVCDHSHSYCGWIDSGHSSGSSSTSANPTTSSRISINPSAVPVEKGMGIEAIDYKNTFDFVVVKGLGRVGAAVSPSNSEQTFFGPPGLELPLTYLQRMQNQQKYPSQKITLATAINLYDNKRGGLEHFEINLGVMGKYNTLTSKAFPGGGLKGVLGPFTFGYSSYSDETQLDDSLYGTNLKPVYDYRVETYSIGMFFGSLALDYSVLHLITTDTYAVSLLTASLILPRAIITVANRTEDSTLPGYDFTTHTLTTQQIKKELFAGGQFSVTNSLMVGLFYNYYLLRELSLSATYFF